MEYKGLIFTNHIMQRMKERDLRYEDVHWIFNNPEKVENGKALGSKKYSRNWQGTRYTLVAKKNEYGKWVLLTCWWKEDNLKLKKKKEKFRSENFWKRVWRMLFEK